MRIQSGIKCGFGSVFSLQTVRAPVTNRRSQEGIHDIIDHPGTDAFHRIGQDHDAQLLARDVADQDIDASADHHADAVERQKPQSDPAFQSSVGHAILAAPGAVVWCTSRNGATGN